MKAWTSWAWSAVATPARPDRPDRLVGDDEAGGPSLPTPSSERSAWAWTTLRVEPASRSASVSPTHRIGRSWFLIADRTFRLMKASVSLK